MRWKHEKLCQVISLSLLTVKLFQLMAKYLPTTKTRMDLQQGAFYKASKTPVAKLLWLTTKRMKLMMMKELTAGHQLYLPISLVLLVNHLLLTSTLATFSSSPLVANVVNATCSSPKLQNLLSSAKLQLLSQAKTARVISKSS